MSQYLSLEELAALGLRRFGSHVMIHRQANLVAPERLSLGSHVRIDGFTTLLATGGIDIGDYVHISSLCFLAGGAGIEMGDFSGLSHGVKVFSTSDDYSGRSLTNPTVPERFRNTESAKVLIGPHSIVGANSVLLPGATLPEGVAVGALALVRGICEPWSIYAGTPARLARSRSREALGLAEQLRREEPE